MSDMNMANRQCCDLDIREYGSNRPWMFAEFCNTTTAGFTSEPVYALKKGGKAIKFDNPLDATMSITFQVHPFRIFALLSDGQVETSAVVPVREELKATAGGTLTLTGEPVAGTVFVYAKKTYGGENDIKGTLEGKAFTATTASELEAGETYMVGYLESKNTGVNKISFNNKKLPKVFRITQETMDKDGSNTLIPLKMTAYKACPQRNMEFSWTSAGEPAELTITFDCFEDENGNVVDLVEIVE